MNTTDLYKLPKDILVKLIMTIQEQTKQDAEKEHQEHLRSIFEMIDYERNYTMDSCCVISCDKYVVRDNSHILYTNTSEKMSECQGCFECFCEEHSNYLKKINPVIGSDIYDPNGEPHCEDCIKYNYNRMI